MDRVRPMPVRRTSKRRYDGIATVDFQTDYGVVTDGRFPLSGYSAISGSI